MLSNKVLKSLTFISALVAGQTLAQAGEASAPISVSLEKPSSSVPVNPLLLGAQYSFFDTPTKAKSTDAELIKVWRSMPVKVLRYPGGTWADHYLWDDPGRSYYAVGNASTIVTPEEFMANCRAVGAEPIFQVNTNLRNGDGDFINPTKIDDIRMGAERAARWVREANKRRNWNIKYWEIGNEVWVWMKPEEYATYVVEYAKAMREVDPTIKIIACGLNEKTSAFKALWLKFPDDPNWVPRDNVQNNPKDWNQALLDIAVGSFDYIAPHLYIDSGDEKMPAEQRYAITNQRIWAAEALHGQVEWAQKMEGKARLAVTEWACNFRESVPVLRDAGKVEDGDLYYFYSLGNGLNTGLAFGKMLEQSKYIDIAVMHSLEDTLLWWYWSKSELGKQPVIHPAFLAMTLWGHHLGRNALTVKTDRVPMTGPEGKTYPGYFLFASEDEKNIYLVAINLDADKEQALSVPRGSGWAQAPVAATWLKGAKLNTVNFASWGGASAPEAGLSDESLPVSKDGLQLTMPAHSMVGLTISKSP